ncbi:hypothetical protein GGG16DRAFT_45909 [Schizophyllum commune]
MFADFDSAVSELGLVSQQLQRGGNGYEKYPGKEFKHDLGLLLFSCIGTLLYLIGHFYTSMGVIMFFTFVFAVFWGTGAGVMFAVTPFRGTNCDADPSTFPPAWQNYVSQCEIVVSIQGVAWALWGLMVLMLAGMIFHACEIRPRKNVSFYGA